MFLRNYPAHAGKSVATTLPELAQSDHDHRNFAHCSVIQNSCQNFRLAGIANRIFFAKNTQTKAQRPVFI
jgi:hypothetical protein